MTGVKSKAYYQRRAEQAERLAKAATAPEVRLIHREMADRYAALAEGEPPQERPTLKMTY